MLDIKLSGFGCMSAGLQNPRWDSPVPSSTLGVFWCFLLLDIAECMRAASPSQHLDAFLLQIPAGTGRELVTIP